MIQKLKLVSLVMLLASCFTCIKGQHEIDGYYISPKLGVYCTSNLDQAGYLVGVKASVMKKQFSYSIGYYYGNEWIIIGSGPDRYFHQAALLFGRYNKSANLRFDYQAGIAAITGIRHTTYYSGGFLEGYYDTEHYLEPGIVLEGGLEYILSGHVSIGTQINLNINPECPMMGFTISLSLGNFSK